MPTPADEWAVTVAGLAAGPAWLMDGNHGGTLPLRLASCDTAVFLDLPRRVCLARLVVRWARHRGRSRPDMAAGCPERLGWEFVRWVWTYPRDRRPRVLQQLAAAAACGVRVVRLRTRLQVDRFLAGLTAGYVPQKVR